MPGTSATFRGSVTNGLVALGAGMSLQVEDGDLAPEPGYLGAPVWVFMPPPLGNGDSFLEPSQPCGLHSVPVHSLSFSTGPSTPLGDSGRSRCIRRCIGCVPLRAVCALVSPHLASCLPLSPLTFPRDRFSDYSPSPQDSPVSYRNKHM